MSASLSEVRDYLLGLQDRICARLEEHEPRTRFERLELEGERGGLSRPRVLDEGEVIERAAVHFSHTVGASLPSAATTRRPELAGQGFEAVSVSVVVHPRNPYVPTVHANLRCFSSDGAGGGAPVWWFGGGFDLTPYYGFEDDAVHWHRNAHAACAPFGEDLYPALKAACDDYFYLPHRKEPRGIGGLFYDDMSEGGFERCFAIQRSLGEHILSGYLPLLEGRKGTSYGEAQRDFQLFRRGRYVEFNLAWDRGTRFGLQSGGRIESILASLPPKVHWRYDWSPEPGSPEARLTSDFLRPRDWLAFAAGEPGE
jgi:coproporphyrinogen III oxidase